MGHSPRLVRSAHRRNHICVKNMKWIILSCIFALVQARPQEIASPDEVELIPAVNNDGVEGDEEGNPVVVVIRGGIPGLGGFFNNVPGFSGFPFRNNVPNLPEVPSVFGSGGFGDFGQIFPQADPSAEVDEENVCGPLCTMFRVLQGIQGEIDDIHTQMNGAGPNIFQGGNHSFFDGNFDVNNSTYEEKELEDGTKIRINRTVLADTDDNGNQFFFHSSVLHNFGDDVAIEALPVPGETEDVDNSDVDIIEEIPESNPALNEINDDIRSDEFPEADAMAIDDGLQQ